MQIDWIRCVCMYLCVCVSGFITHILKSKNKSDDLQNNKEELQSLVL